ncbi:MAG: hypothetical protein IT331_15740 [Anaerolineae bacterium]|nr:hypothetical protein [Anaerolineae bacterium]
MNTSWGYGEIGSRDGLNLSTGGEILRVNSVKVGEPSTKWWWQYRAKFHDLSEKRQITKKV